METKSKTAQKVEKTEIDLHKEVVDDNTTTSIKYSSLLKSFCQNLSVVKSRESLSATSPRNAFNEDSGKPPDIHLPKIKIPKFNDQIFSKSFILL